MPLSEAVSAGDPVEKLADYRHISLRAAVDAYCEQCWGEHVGACTVRACPLWPVRPQSLR